MTHLFDIDEGMKQIIDLVSITTVFGTLMGALPSVAALLSIAWSALRIYETKTVQRFIARMQEKNDGKDV